MYGLPCMASLRRCACLLTLWGCSKQDQLLHPPSALRVLRGGKILYLCESLGTSPFFFGYPLEITKSRFLHLQKVGSGMRQITKAGDGYP